MRKRTGRENTFDTDRYETRWYIGDDTVTKTIWASDTYVGPEAYNNGHVDRILEPRNGRAMEIINPQSNYNPYIANRSTLSKDNVKFTP